MSSLLNQLRIKIPKKPSELHIMFKDAITDNCYANCLNQESCTHMELTTVFKNENNMVVDVNDISCCRMKLLNIHLPNLYRESDSVRTIARDALFLVCRSDLMFDVVQFCDIESFVFFCSTLIESGIFYNSVLCYSFLFEDSVYEWLQYASASSLVQSRNGFIVKHNIPLIGSEEEIKRFIADDLDQLWADVDREDDNGIHLFFVYELFRHIWTECPRFVSFYSLPRHARECASWTNEEEEDMKADNVIREDLQNLILSLLRIISPTSRQREKLLSMNKKIEVSKFFDR